MKLQITQTSEGRTAQLNHNAHPYKVIYETTPPGGFFGYYGPSVCETQSVGVRFTPRSGHYLKKIGLWFMNNGNPNVPIVKVSIRNDRTQDKSSIPGDEILEDWKFNVSAHGWSPVFEELDSEKSPYLEEGTHYWIVAESKDPCSDDGVWVMAGESIGFSSVTNDGVWQPGGEGAVPALVVWGLPPIK